MDSFKSPFVALEQEKSNDLIEWTWNYIQGRIEKDLNLNSSQLLQQIVPTTLEEKYQAILAIHDYFYTKDKNLHKVFCSEYKRALSQKKFREKENIKLLISK